MHLKRQKMPKKWPIPRKGNKYIVSPRFSPQQGVPLLIVLRDMLKVAQNRKEVKRVIHQKTVLVNNKSVIDERKNVLLLDTVALIPQKEFYRLSLSLNGKFKLEKIKEIEANKKVSKIINKKILKKKKTQLNLGDGRNFLSEVACKVGDSALINFKDKKVEKCVPLKEKSTVLVFAGKHSGKKGVIEKFNLERKMATLKVEEGSINVLIKQLMALE